MEKTNFLEMRQLRRRINILGVLIDELTVQEAVTRIEEWSQHKREQPGLPSRVVVTANPEYVMAALHEPELKRIINDAAMVTPDGVGVTLAGKLYRTPFRGRVTGVELTHALAESSSRTGLRLFLLGAAPGVAEIAADKLQQLYPGVVIAGCYAGNAKPEGDEEAIKRIQQAKADVILVAYGIRKQDYWSARNQTRSGAAAAIGVGGTFDFLSSRVRWAPETIRKMGLEWAYRLYQEPWRWRRDIAMVRFGSKIIFSSFFGLNFIVPKRTVIYEPELTVGLDSLEYLQKWSA